MTIQQDILVDIQNLKKLAPRVQTDRFGPFTFQVGLDPQALELPLMCVHDAHRRFIGSPRLSCVKARPTRPFTAIKRSKTKQRDLLDSSSKCNTP